MDFKVINNALSTALN